MAMQRPQDLMQAKLKEAGIPHKTIRCYGRQIVVTALSAQAADKWADLLRQFSTVTNVLESVDETKDPMGYFKKNPGLVKSFFTHRVWRVYATV